MKYVLLALMLLAAPVWAQDRPVIVADSYPVAYFAERLAQDAAEVRIVVPEGRDPASWRPSLAEIVDIQAADLIVLNGSGLSDWTTRAALPRARTVDTGRGLEDDLIATGTITHSHGEEGSHSHEGVATHTWLDLELAARQAQALARAMVRVLPDVDVAENLAELLTDLSALDAMGNALSDGAAIPVITSHPRYEYLGNAYGLDVNALDWAAGETPDADQIAQLEAIMDRTGAQILIWEVEPTSEALSAVAELGLAQTVMPSLIMRPGEGDFLSQFELGLSELKSEIEMIESQIVE